MGWSHQTPTFNLHAKSNFSKQFPFLEATAAASGEGPPERAQRSATLPAVCADHLHALLARRCHQGIKAPEALRRHWCSRARGSRHCAGEEQQGERRSLWTGCRNQSQERKKRLSWSG